MGLCLGRCLSDQSENLSSVSDGQDNNLMECIGNVADNNNQNTSSSSTSSIFRILKMKSKRRSTFIDRFWARQKRHHQQHSSSYTRLNASRENSASTLESNDQSLFAEKRTTKPPEISNDMIHLQCLDASSLLLMHDRRGDYYRLRPESLTEDTASLAGSSLDLEWEHEYGAASRQQQQPWLRSHEELAMMSTSCSEENCSSSEMSRNTSSNSKLNYKNNNHRNANNNKFSQQRSRRNSSGNDTHADNAAEKLVSNRPKSNTSWSHISTPDSLEWDVHEDDSKFKSEEDLLDRETMELLHEIEWLKNRALNETGDSIPWGDTRQEES